MGEVFAGRYELLEPIAEGGMGSVWTVRDLELGQVKAAKLLRQSDAGSVLRFIREQSMRIDHPHVVTPQTWAGADDRVLFTMALVRGGSVATLLGDMGPLPASWVGALLDQTLQALEAVHAAGIVHRDVKPANLLLHPTGTGVPHLLLTDFGVAVPVHEPRLTRTSQVFATPGYTADEQLHGADPDPRQDLYSVGMVGLEMVSGVWPPEAREAALRRAEAEPELGPLVRLLTSAASSDPARRPACADDFRRQLEALDLPAVRTDDGPCVFMHYDEAGHTAEGTPPPEAGQRKPVPRSNQLVGVTLLLVAALCLVGAVVLALG